MLPMGEGPFPYAQELLYCSKPVRPFSWPACPHPFNARTAFSLLFGLRLRVAFVLTAKPVVQFRLRCRSRIRSVHEPSHTNVHYHSKRQEREEN